MEIFQFFSVLPKNIVNNRLAAMRMRQLAVSQSVVFYAPPEVHQSILNAQRKTVEEKLDSYDVVSWLLEQTCANIKQLEPLYVSQGTDYCRREASSRQNIKAAQDQAQRLEYLQVLKQAEHYSLEELYAPNHKPKPRPFSTDGQPDLAEYISKLNAMKHNLQDTGDIVQALAHQEVEQEREVEIEVETVREVKKPKPARPVPQQPLQKSIRTFAITGRLPIDSTAYLQAFAALGNTAVGRRLGIRDNAVASKLFVTKDFTSTVDIAAGSPRDEYSRPVHWILWSNVTETALILSDFEANAILSIIRHKVTSCTHLICYAAPVTKAMVPFDKLDFYVVPALPDDWIAPGWLVSDLGIFAGRLYFDYDDQYHAVRDVMGLPISSASAVDAIGEAVEAKDCLGEQEKKRGPFSDNALLFMQEWLAVRRKGQDFSQTMMGDICSGRVVLR